jgi:endothelin-converting enzyme/putative endopeptidase
MKAKTLLMTTQIEAAMKARIERLDWMRPATKREAIEKLAKIRNKIGYPDVWRDYSALTIGRGDFLGNVTRSISFESRRQAAKIGQPVDHGEWEMSAPTVNAYYDAQLNDVNFPAGVLLPPLYDAKMDDAPNYGDTGGTIGHELTHAFDDQGRKFDGDGNLRDWWTMRDAAAFETRAQCVRDQYSQYVIVDDVKINGALTSGEDIADLGGELLAWMAWQEETRSLQLTDKDDLSPAGVSLQAGSGARKAGREDVQDLVRARGDRRAAVPCDREPKQLAGAGPIRRNVSRSTPRRQARA